MLFIVALFGMRRQGIVQLDVAFVCTDLLRKSNLIYKWIIAREKEGEGEMIMGQIGEYRELNLEERREHLAQQLKDAQVLGEILEGLQGEEKEAQSIAEMFAELLGCLADAHAWLHEINERFEKCYPDDMDPKDPAAPFWYAVAEAIEPLDSVYDDLEAIEKDMPREPAKERVP